jgi:hypothetical protein
MPDASKQGKLLILNGIYNIAFFVYPFFEGFSLQFYEIETAIPYISFFPQGQHPI